MNKELTPLEALNDLIEGLEDEHLGLSESEWVVERKQIIETALKEKETQDSILKTLKEIIKFSITLPYIEPNKDNGFDIMSAVGINIQRDIENRERKLLRKWVLETCFPKELKALEIIKREAGYGISFDGQSSDGIYGVCIDGYIKCNKDEYDLLKEALL